MKKSCVIYDSWKTLLVNLSDEMAGALIKMILEYALDGRTNPHPSEAVNAMFFMIKDKLDEDAEAWEEVKRQRSEAGKKAMSKRWGDNKSITNDNTVITNDNGVITNDNKDITNITVSDSVSVSVSDKDKKKNTKKKSTFYSFPERNINYEELKNV